MVAFSTLVTAAFAGVAAAAPQYGSSSSYGSSGSSGSYGSSGSSSSYGSSGSSGSYGSSGSSCSGSSCGSSSSAPPAVVIGSSSCSGSSCDSSIMSMDSGMGMMSMDSNTQTMLDTSTVMMDTTSTMMEDTTSTMMMDTTSTMMMDTTSTMMEESTSTSSAQISYNTATYGSGSSNWGGSSYNSCVQQCMATYGAPMATETMASSTQSSGSSGSGATHTVIVAPSQGVLRFVPFYTNANVGDTVKFVWMANMHTVTKSSQLELCNKTDDAPFASGVQNKSFVFTQVVNDTQPTFFYCGVPTHCEKGMFGIINPPSVANNINSSASAMISSMSMNSSSVAAMSSYTSMMTANNSAAASWGSTLDVSSMPGSAAQPAIENVMFTRTFLAANPEVLNADGSVNLGLAGSNPLMVPQDITNVLSSGASSSAAAGPTGSSPAAAAGSSPSASAGAHSGAGSVTASRALVGVVALAATFFAL